MDRLENQVISALEVGVLPIEILVLIPRDRWFLAKQYIVEHQEYVRRQAYCDKVGHKLVADGSFGNGETGGEYGHCTHCGWTFDITYY